MQIITATELKRDMKKIFDRAINNHEAVIVKRPHSQDVAIIDLAEYESLKETAYLLGDPANAAHLALSLRQIRNDETVAKSLDELVADDTDNV